MLSLVNYLLIALGINLIMFVPAFWFKTDKLTDLSYAITFIVLVLVALKFGGFGFLKLVLTLMVVAWAVRLGGFLFVRIRHMKKDVRFDGVRESFLKFQRFFLLQGLAVWVILLPCLIFMNSNATEACWLGFVVWAFGAVTEAVADLQKYSFKLKVENKSKFLSTGLWKYSRHPNYFGEILCWVGIYIFVFPALSALELAISLASPILITVLLVFVTGLPQLEKRADRKWGGLEEYIEYKRKTSILVPWIKKN